ncbi:MAG: SDR family NAD(P)-dependent oxidoreductase [Candidatus Methylacidiphilales bacterium]
MRISEVIEPDPKTAVITGGAKGLGSALSTAFRDAGWKVWAASRSKEGAEVEFDDQLVFHPCDVTRRSDLVTLAGKAATETGRIDAWINNAGVSAWKALVDIDESFWNHMLSVNLTGCFFGCQAAAAHMEEGGAIINISSLAGKRGSARNSAYCAAKFGVNGVTQSLAKELGPRGIRVNAVCPVYVDTPGLREALEEPVSPAAGQDVNAYLDDFRRSQSALLRLPQAQEVAATCLYLASSAASAITGQCLNVDCGVVPS